METEVMEQNKLIAEFEGFEFVNDHPTAYPNGYYMLDRENDCSILKLEHEFEYHTSWDWQQPVYQKVCKAFKECTDDRKPYFHHRLFDVYPSHYRHGEPDKAAFILAEAIQYLNSHL